jgi:excinuclease ABC subunit C
LEHFGSLRGIRNAPPDALTAVVNAATAEKIRSYFDAETTQPKVTLQVLQ